MTHEDFEFAKHFGGKLDEAIDAHDLTRDEAAEKLGVHRSMLFRYLGGRSIPGSKVLQRACEQLGLSVDYRGVNVDADYFISGTRVEKPRPVPAQAEFAFMRESFASQFARVDIRKKKHAMNATLEVRMTVSLGKTKS
jgi:transcriptional regulator with XRE-family HTH domain